MSLEGLAKHPNSACIRNLPIETQPQKPHEGKAIPDLVFQPFVQQPVQPLQDQEFEHQHPACRLAARRALANLLVNPLQVGAKNLPVHGVIQPLQWITQPTQVGIPSLQIQREERC